MVGVIISILLSFFFWIVSPTIFPKKYHKCRVWLNKYVNKEAFSSLIFNGNKDNIVYDNIIFIGINEQKFSEMAEKLMDEEDSQIIITNSREPCWFYKKFRNAVFDTRTGNFNAQTIIQNLENIFKQETIDYKSAYKQIIELRKLFFEKKVINNVFPHLIKFAGAGSPNLVKKRLNFFKYNANNPDTCEFDNFKSDNTKLHLFFFETFINYKVKSIFCNICESEYEGEDALILSNRVLLYNNIKELHYRPSINSCDFYQYVIQHVCSKANQESKLIAKQFIGDIKDCYLLNY